MSTSQRISKLERTIRSRARGELTDEVYARFEPALQLAANDEDIVQHLKQLREGVIKSKRAERENQALEAFLEAKDPAPRAIDLDALRNPATVLIAANGERLPDTATNAMAILLPQFDLLYTVETWKASNWKHALELGAKFDLFDGAGQWQLWDDVEASLTIDRSVHGPAVIPAFRGCTPTDDWYWTRTPLASSPSDYAIFVYLRYGHVSWSSQNNAGRVRAVRRVPASQFGVLAVGGPR